MDFEVVDVWVYVKTVGKRWFCSYKLFKKSGSLARNARFEDSLVFLSQRHAYGEAAKPLIFEGFKTLAFPQVSEQVLMPFVLLGRHITS